MIVTFDVLTWRFPTGRFLFLIGTIVYTCWNLFDINAVNSPVKFAAWAWRQHISSAPLVLIIRPVCGALRAIMRNCKQRKMFKYIGQGEMVQRPQKLKIASCLEGLKYIVGELHRESRSHVIIRRMRSITLGLRVPSWTINRFSRFLRLSV